MTQSSIEQLELISIDIFNTITEITPSSFHDRSNDDIDFGMAVACLSPSRNPLSSPCLKAHAAMCDPIEILEQARGHKLVPYSEAESTDSGEALERPSFGTEDDTMSVWPSVDDDNLFSQGTAPLSTEGCPGVDGGLTLSRGSELHEVQQCKPCLYLPSAHGCKNGRECLFCHAPHGRKPRARPSKSTRTQCKKILDMLDTLPGQDPQTVLSVIEPLEAKSAYMRSLLNGKKDALMKLRSVPNSIAKPTIAKTPAVFPPAEIEAGLATNHASLFADPLEPSLDVRWFQSWSELSSTPAGSGADRAVCFESWPTIPSATAELDMEAPFETDHEVWYIGMACSF